MALTAFGKAVRKARLDINANISTMAEALNLSPAFISAIETGRKKIPSDVVTQVQNFFAAQGVVMENLPELADVSNKSVSLEGLSFDQQILVASFARRGFDSQTLADMKQLLEAGNAK